MVEEITQRVDLVNKIKNKKQKALLLVYSENCGHCVTYKPVYESVSRKYPTLKFFKVERSVLGSDDLKKMDVRAFPTTLFVDNDFRTIEELKVVGNRKDQLENNINLFISQN